MRKTMLSVFPALLVLILCALLPQLANRFLDRDPEPGTAQLPSIELEFRQEPVLSVLKRIALVRSGVGLQVNVEDRTHMTREEAQAAAREALKPYQEAGLITPPGDVGTMEARLLYDRGFGWYGYFWYIPFHGTDGYYLDLVLDDKTGQILEIIYDNPGLFYEPEQTEEMLLQFQEVYRQGLGLDIPGSVDIFLPRYDKKYYFRRCLWEDEEWSEIVEFHMYDCGFMTVLGGSSANIKS